MDNLIQFSYDSKDVRVIKNEAGNPCWMAKGVCDVLELDDVGKAVEKLDDNEKLTRKLFGSGQPREMWTINEPGLYTPIIRSNKPEAKPFKRWITHELLRSTRKNGLYAVPDTNPGELAVKKHAGIRVNQRIRLLEMAYRMNDMDTEGRRRLFDDYNLLCGVFCTAEPKQRENGLLTGKMLEDFIAERCHILQDEAVNAKELYEHFVAWYRANHGSP